MASGLAFGDQRRRTGSGSGLEALRDDALYKCTLLYFTFTLYNFTVFFRLLLRYTGVIRLCFFVTTCFAAVARCDVSWVVDQRSRPYVADYHWHSAAQTDPRAWITK